MTYYVNDQLTANRYTSEQREWEALSELCKEARVSVLVIGDGSFNVLDHDTNLQTTVDSKDDVINIIQARIDYINNLSGYNWQ